MDEQKRPRAREKKVVSDGKGVEKKGQGLGIGPVNNTGNYADRKQQQSASSGLIGSKPQKPGYGQEPQSRPGPGTPSGQQRPQNPFGFPPVSGSASSDATGSGHKQYHSAQKMNGTATQRAAGTRSGGGKLILIVIALAVLLGGGGLSGLFGGEDLNLPATTQSDNSFSVQQNNNGNSGMPGIGNLLSAFLGSGGHTAYDFTGSAESLLSNLAGSGTGVSQNAGVNQYFTSLSTPEAASGGSNTVSLDETVSKKARSKYTVIRGNNRDTVTILIYMCGTDLESQQGMATSDLKEMANATVGRNVNLIVYTGGCRRWRNNVISSSVNQIYRISDGQFECLEQNAGNGSMVNPETLVSFIEYGKKHYPADRMCLIFWDHGGGSVSGFGYDEKIGHNQSMTLAGINAALKKADMKFDFIGFDACLMATVENGLMLSQYADYMIASEETEPGVGWYYTNWLTRLGKNTSMPTIEIGRIIADDFVDVCNRQCRGQATTLSVVDLAELQATVPEELKQFSIGTNGLIQNKEFKTVSKARSRTREFAQQSRIDQIDLVDFARNMGTGEGKALAKALQGAVKYNRTGGSISNAYGLSIYFPYKRTNKVNQMVSTYEAIGMDEEYTRCIQEFASLEVSGQVGAGTPLSAFSGGQSSYSGLLGSLMGNGSGSISYSQNGLEELLGGLYGSSGSTGSILDLFAGRTMTAERAAESIMENHLDASKLQWRNGRITLDSDQWDLVTDLAVNVFYNDGNGFVDLGLDTTFTTEGNSLLSDFDGTWLSIDRQPVAYYILNTVEEGDNYVISGYVPAILNGEHVRLILNFDSERPDGYIAGAIKMYSDAESDTQAKELIAIGKGDVLQFLCDYYDYDENYRDTYKLGNPVVLGDTVEIANTPIDMSKSRVTFRFTDIYQKNYWTAPVNQ